MADITNKVGTQNAVQPNGWTMDDAVRFIQALGISTERLMRFELIVQAGSQAPEIRTWYMPLNPFPKVTPTQPTMNIEKGGL